MKTELKIDLKTIIIIIVAVIFLMGGGFGWLGNKLNKTADQLALQQNLTMALQADLTYTKNKLDEEVASKMTLQADVKELKDINLNLTDNQKELLSRIKGLEKDNNIISAALVETQTKLDSLLIDDGEVTVGDDFVTIAKATDSLTFDITMNNVQTLQPYKEPTLSFNELLIPNKNFIEFHWDNNKKYKQKPVSFSITNSSPFVTTTQVDSYIIPEVNYKVLNPSFGERVGEFFNKPAVKWVGGAIIFGTGIYVGTKL